jgi:hypothetical protein
LEDGGFALVLRTSLKDIPLTSHLHLSNSNQYKSRFEPLPTMSEHDLHMASGDGKTSYAKNSRLQVTLSLSLFLSLSHMHAEVLLASTPTTNDEPRRF